MVGIDRVNRDECMEGDDPRKSLYNRVADLCLRPSRFNNGGIVTEVPFFGYDCDVNRDGTAFFTEYQTTSVGSLRRIGASLYEVTAVPPPAEGATWRDEATEIKQEFASPGEALDWFLSVASPTGWIPPSERPPFWRDQLTEINPELVASFEEQLSDATGAKRQRGRRA